MPIETKLQEKENNSYESIVDTDNYQSVVDVDDQEVPGTDSYYKTTFKDNKTSTDKDEINYADEHYVDKIDEQNKRIENLEMYLSKMVSKAKFAEDEIDMALTLVMYMVDGDKQKYQRNCNKVSNKSKEKLDTIKKKIGKV